MAHGRGHKEHNHHRSSERKFEKHIIQIDQRPIACRKLFCSTPGCGQQGEVIDRTTDGLPSAVIVRKFVQKGWEVGNDSRGDLCPSCVKSRQVDRRAKRFKPINGNVVALVATEVKPMLDTAPQDMSRSDRRIIFAKLEEVYEDEEKGYRVPWTDAAVARDLGSHIPVSWVAQVREENFGPAKDNGEIRDMLARVQAAATEATAILDEARKLRTEVSALVERSNALMTKATEVGKTLNGLLTIADRIHKAVQ